jgi:group I intron endonuclease
MIYGIIYKYTSPSGGIYIGQTIKTVEKRIQQHINESNKGSNKIFHKAIKKYGIKNFEYEILYYAYSKDELNQLEITCIEKYNSYYKNNINNGYNMTIGGEGTNGYIRTESDREKLSQSLKKYFKNNPEAIVKLSEKTTEYNKNHPERLQKHSEFMKEYMNSPEVKERVRNIFKKYKEENPEASSLQQIEVWKRDGYKEKMSLKQKQFLENNPEEKSRRINRLVKWAKDNPEKHSEFMKEKSNTPEKKALFKTIIENDRKNNPEKYANAKEKRKETMNTPEFKENMSNKKRKILNTFQVFDNTGKLIGEFNNTIDCIKELNIGKSPSIVKCLNGDLRQSCGYIFTPLHI